MDNDRMETFAEDVKSGVKGLKSAFESSDTFEEVVQEAEKLWSVLDEGEDVLDEIDYSDVPDVVDADDASEAIDVEDVPEAISEGDPKEVIDMWGVYQALKLKELWDSADMREVWREAREFEDAVDDLDDDSDDGEDDGMLSDPDMGGGAMDDAEVESEVQSEVYESKIQSELHDSAETFREKLLETRNRLAEAKAENEKKGGPGQPSSRNPTAVSTLSLSDREAVTVTKFSTVPTETRHSSAPNMERIYGDRFEEKTDD
ncbi:hypothetical protein [Haladaptatus sp. NG-SE-30]